MIGDKPFRELTVTGSPAEIAAAAELFTEHSKINSMTTVTFFTDPELRTALATVSPDAPLVRMSIGGYGWRGPLLVAQRIGGGETLLTFSPGTDRRVAVRWWDAFVAELGRLKFLTAQSKPRGEPGNKRNPAHDWAREEVLGLGRPPNEVFPEWESRYRQWLKEIKNKKPKLDWDAKDHFKKILKQPLKKK